MIEESVLQRTLQTALRHGGEFAEVFAEDRRNSSALLDDGRVEELTSGRDRGAGIVGTVDVSQQLQRNAIRRDGWFRAVGG